MLLGGQLVTDTVDDILAGRVTPIPQEQMPTDTPLRPAPKIFKETCRIDWQQPTKAVYDFIRGLSPYPAAWTELVTPDGKCMVLKVYQTEKRLATHTFPVGSIHSDGKSYVDVATADGYIRLLSVQLAGKKRMPIHDFLNGFKQIALYRAN